MMKIPEGLMMALREIANRAGAPTMTYAPDTVIYEQRASLDWIALRAKSALDICRFFNENVIDEPLQTPEEKS